MNRFVKTAIATSVLATSTMALAEFSANVAMTTNYVWRGVSQSDLDPAIQGGFDFSHSSGLYAGTWGSNVDFDEAVADPADMEWDLYAGYSTEVNGVGIDVGVIQYAYPGSTADLDWVEFYGSASYKFLTLSFAHSSDAFNSNQDGTYVNLGASFEVSGFTLGASVGSYDIDTKNDYVDYKLSVSKEIGGFGFELGYTDTDLSRSECNTDYATTDDWCGSSLILTVSKEL